MEHTRTWFSSALRRAQAIRLSGEATAAWGLVGVDAAARLLNGGPYGGSTALLVAACGLSVLPLLPTEVSTPTLRMAALPALAMGTFSVLLTSVSILGIPLNEATIRLSVAVLVGLCMTLQLRVWPAPQENESRAPGRRWEWLSLFALVGVVAVSLETAWDVEGHFPPPGRDWGHYFLYADEVRGQQKLLVDSPLWMGGGMKAGNDPGIGAVYGSLEMLDGVSAPALAPGMGLISALAPLSFYAAVGALWGHPAGLLAAAAYAAAPVRLEPLRWHGLATTYAFLFLPILFLALGLLYRGGRDWRTACLLGFSLASLLAAHRASAVFGVLVCVVALVGDVVGRGARLWRGKTGEGDPTGLWPLGVAGGLARGMALGGVLGGGVIAHAVLQLMDLGPPPSSRAFGRLDVATFAAYHPWPFTSLAALSLGLVVATRARSGDRGPLAAVTAFTVAGLITSQLWVAGIPFDYRRAAYYLAVPMVALIAVAPLRQARPRLWGALWLAALGWIVHGSIGLNVADRLLARPGWRSSTVTQLREFGKELATRESPTARRIVTDGCLNFIVPYLTKTPTLAAVAGWQMATSKEGTGARLAERVLYSGERGVRLARRLHVVGVVADPKCSLEAVRGLPGAIVVFQNDEVIIATLPAAARVRPAQARVVARPLASGCLDRKRRFLVAPDGTVWTRVDRANDDITFVAEGVGGVTEREAFSSVVQGATVLPSREGSGLRPDHLRLCS